MRSPRRGSLMILPPAVHQIFSVFVHANQNSLRWWVCYLFQAERDFPPLVDTDSCGCAASVHIYKRYMIWAWIWMCRHAGYPASILLALFDFSLYLANALSIYLNEVSPITHATFFNPSILWFFKSRSEQGKNVVVLEPKPECLDDKYSCQYMGNGDFFGVKFGQIATFEGALHKNQGNSSNRRSKMWSI